MNDRSRPGKAASDDFDQGQRTASLDRRMVANYRRSARRTRDEDQVAELLAAVFGQRMLPADVLARLRRAEP